MVAILTILTSLLPLVHWVLWSSTFEQKCWLTKGSVRFPRLIFLLSHVLTMSSFSCFLFLHVQCWLAECCQKMVQSTKLSSLKNYVRFNIKCGTCLWLKKRRFHLHELSCLIKSYKRTRRPEDTNISVWNHSQACLIASRGTIVSPTTAKHNKERL